MTIVNTVFETLPRVHAKLYPSYLPGQETTFLARDDDEASLSIEETCAALINRGGYPGKLDELVSAVKQFIQELVYQLCSGFSVNTGFFSIHLKIGGSWANVSEPFDPIKHPIGLTLYTHHALREILKHITVEIDGLAPMSAWIAEVIDADTGSVNSGLNPDGDFIIKGHNIKVTKEETGCGLFLLGPILPDTVLDETPVTRFAENTAGKVIARTPSWTAPGEYKLVIRTKFSGGVNLKEMRTIEAPFTLTIL
ncbi:hypothetical protein AGMMS49942_11960 [Spirochaetia bacterium]|nr:hypothetical protein AGMMS49942_11960 [Spirochaetia bacterium]